MESFFPFAVETQRPLSSNTYHLKFLIHESYPWTSAENSETTQAESKKISRLQPLPKETPGVSAEAQFEIRRELQDEFCRRIDRGGGREIYALDDER